MWYAVAVLAVAAHCSTLSTLSTLHYSTLLYSTLLYSTQLNVDTKQDGAPVALCSSRTAAPRQARKLLMNDDLAKITMEMKMKMKIIDNN